MDMHVHTILLACIQQIAGACTVAFQALFRWG